MNKLLKKTGKQLKHLKKNMTFSKMIMQCLILYQESEAVCDLCEDMEHCTSMVNTGPGFLDSCSRNHSA